MTWTRISHGLGTLFPVKDGVEQLLEVTSVLPEIIDGVEDILEQDRELTFNPLTLVEGDVAVEA